MSAKINVYQDWTADIVCVDIDGDRDLQMGDVIVVLGEPVRHARTDHRMCTFTNGHVLKASFDLTPDQAEALAHKLLNAVAEHNKMDAEYEAYVQANKEQDDE